ncbi:MAG: efflux RND transporter periplasmic adaptor subunit [Deltaproteobacteria bacterium]|nr:efflux RND transporter periplasmic adaptor subunit [Deltaproteobacteria bacterium]
MDRQIKKKWFGPKQISWLVFVVIIAIFAVYYFFYQDTSSKLNVRTEKIIISTITEEPFQEFIPVLGKVMPVTTVFLDAIEGGRVEKKFVEAGAWVKEGDKILHLSNTNLVINIMQREAEYVTQSDNLQKSRLSMEQKKLAHITLMAELDYQLQTKMRDYEQSEALFQKKVISRKKYADDKEIYEYLIRKKRLAEENFTQEINFRQVQIEQFEASLKRMSANLELIKEKLESLTIRAPISGQLTVLNAEIGESKALGQRLGQINVMDDLKIITGIDEHYIARVKEGNIGTFDLEGSTHEVTHEVNIVKILPDVREGQFVVELKFIKNPLSEIRIGQTLHIKLTLGELTKVITVPRGGFYQSTAGQWIYVLDSTGSFATKRSIRLGRKNADVFEVLEGLNPREKVITSNYDNFEDMDKLILK